MAVKHYKHTFVNCHLTISPPNETPPVIISLQKPVDKPLGDYSTADENIQKLIAKSSYSKNKSGLRIFEVSEKEAKKTKGDKPQKPQYKVGVMSGIK